MPSRDAFYVLSDSLVALILSKLPIRDAVKTSILSKRWRFLYTHMPTLTLSVKSVLGLGANEAHTMSKAENIISNILLLRSRNLDALYIDPQCSFYLNSIQGRFSYENVCAWVRYAASRNVQHLTLSDGDSEEMSPPALFSCSRLVTLSLTGYVLTRLPTAFVGFPHLISCYLDQVKLTDESLLSFISLCPLLQKLEIFVSSALGRVDIFSSTIEHLYIEEVNYLSVNCPKLKILEVTNVKDLRVHGAKFFELSQDIRDLKMHPGGSVRELSIVGSGHISATRFVDILGNFRSLENLDINMEGPFEIEEKRGVRLLNLLCRLPNLQSFSMSGFFLEELARDPIPECLAPPLFNLKKIRIELDEFDKKEIAIIRCLLQSTPCLERMEIQRPIYRAKHYEHQSMFFKDYEHQSMFYKDVLHLRRASSLARIIVNI